MKAILESCGITFEKIPAGDYAVGYAGDAKLAHPPQSNYIGTPVTPITKVSVGDFYISTQPLRILEWEKLRELPQLSVLNNLVPVSHLLEISERAILESTIEILPTAGEYQTDSHAKSKHIPQQLEPNPVVTLHAKVAAQVAIVLGGTLPTWAEWEIATRGTTGYLYPWGNAMDVAALSLSRDDYSVDTESTMGYYSYDQEVYFIHSFGEYMDKPSPFGLRGLARPGREWNTGDEYLKAEEDMPFILRSLSDLGAMAGMIPGIRPNTWGSAISRAHNAFSGPILPCYFPATYKVRSDLLYPEAGFRLVFRE